MAFQFPWTNLHELNLDWFLSKFKQFTNNYLGTTATAESVPNGTPPSVTVTGGELDDDTDIVDPFTFNFKIPAGAQGEQGIQGIPGQDGFSPIATVTKSGTVATITITDAYGTTTTTISDGEVTQAQLDTKAPVILPTGSGAVVNFSDGADDMPMSELVVGITPLQSGSGTPAPDNIRPISGWTGCSVTMTGKNLTAPFADSTGNNKGMIFSFADNLITLTGTTTQTNADTTNKYFGGLDPFSILLKAGVTYTASLVGRVNISSRLRLFFAYNASNKLYSDSTTGVWTFTPTTDLTVNQIKFRAPDSGTVLDVEAYFQLEVGTGTATYEPFQGTSLAVDWTTEAGTVYGGTLDVATGVLTVTHAFWTKNTSEMDNSENYPGWKNSGIKAILGADINSVYLNAVMNCGTSFNVNTTVNRDILFLSTSQYGASMTQTAWQALAIDVQIVVELATPQTYQLTPQQLFNTLYGVNNVWSDTGDSTVTYPADTKLYIEQLTQPAEDDMTANTTIANGKFFMVGNNLYQATTAIASGSQIIPGTNATPMSLADALNSL